MNNIFLIKPNNVALQQARTLCCRNKYDQAFKFYLTYLGKISLEDRCHIQKEFIFALISCSKYLQKIQLFEEAMQCFEDALKYFPGNVDILLQLGVELGNLNCYSSGIRIFENILAQSKNYPPAEQELDNIKNKMVDRWHFFMLNDSHRNTAYRDAIFINISKGHDRVLDIGTGTGILSLLCAQNQTASVTACECNETMYEIAQQVIGNANMNNIHLVNKDSTELNVPSDMEVKASLLITEIFDCGLFGEEVLQTMVHAWENLLEPAATTIPAGADLFICGINCVDIFRKRCLVKSENMFLRLNDMCFIYGTEDDPYDSEKLQRKNVAFLTDVRRGLHVDFNDVQQLKALCYGGVDDDENANHIHLRCTEAGELHAFAVWFNLNLSGSVSLTSSPFADENDSCWEQAILYLHHPIKLAKGERIKVRLDCTNGKLKTRIIEPAAAQQHQQQQHRCQKCIEVTQDFLFFANDTALIESLRGTATHLCAEAANRAAGAKENRVTVLDAMPFPILGILMALQVGANVTFVVRSAGNEHAIRVICCANGADENLLRFVADADFEEYANAAAPAADETDRFDYVFMYPVSPTGALSDRCMMLHSTLKTARLKADGKILPKMIRAEMRLVGCEYLNRVNMVNDENTCGFKIAQFINKYRTQEHCDIDLDLQPYAMSECHRFEDALDYDESNAHRPRCVNAKLTSASGKVNAILYWFEMAWLDDTATTTTITLRKNERNFNNNCCFVLHEPIDVAARTHVAVCFTQCKGCIQLRICAAPPADD